ncbi:MAG: transglycosylase SLT domain-containing protein [Pseudomonadota bacterium]
MRSVAVMLAVWLALSGSAGAVERIAALCDAAGARAAQRMGVPVEVLRAITRAETGRTLAGAHRPWPWTVNMEGEGRWFSTPEEALAYVRAHHARGARSYDVGCFQINYRWHGQEFASVEQMFDPNQNALYAARFLRDLYAEKGSWGAAAGAYHSRTPKFATRYRARFERILARLGGADLPAPSGVGSEPLAVAEAAPGPAPVQPLAIDGPLTISPPSGAVLGSTAGIHALPAGRPLLSGARGPLF